MLRILGAGFILAGCTGIGLFYKQRFHEALWHLRYMEQVLERFISEIRYDKATLPECCKRIGERTKQPYGQEAAKKLEFIEAAQYRDELLRLEDMLKERWG